MATLQQVVKALKAVDEKKVVITVESGYGYNRVAKKVCALCEHHQGAGIHFDDCPFELAKKVEV